VEAPEKHIMCLRMDLFARCHGTIFKREANLASLFFVDFFIKKQRETS